MATYIFSDLHGNYDLWNKIKNYLKEDDIAYCLGDCIDRGKDGIKILTEILNDNRISLIKGNHEDMLVQCAEELLYNDIPAEDVYYYWYGNGGEPTLLALSEMSKSEVKDLVKTLDALPQRIDLINEKNQKIILTHVGTDPWFNEKELRLRGRGSYPYLWDRKHIRFNWNNNPEWENVYVIHGHTPVQYFLPKEEIENPNYVPIVKEYADGHKIDIDLGTPFSNRACLLNIQNFEKIYFD